MWNIVSIFLPNRQRALIYESLPCLSLSAWISMGRGISSFPALSGNGKVIPELNCFFLVNKSKTNPRDKIVEICAHFMMLPKF